MRSRPNRIGIFDSLVSCLFQRIKHLLYNLDLDPRGKAILDHLTIKRFVPVKEELYDPIRRMVLALNTHGPSPIAYDQSAH